MSTNKNNELNNSIKSTEIADGNFSVSKNANVTQKNNTQPPLQDQINLFDNLQEQSTIKNYNETLKAEQEQTSNITVKKVNNNLKLSSDTQKSFSTKKNKKKKEQKIKINLLNFNRPPKKILEVNTTPEEETEKIGEAEQAVKKQSSKKKKLLNLLLLIVNLGIVAGLFVYNLLGDTQMTSFPELLTSKINWGIFFLAVIISSSTMLFDAAKCWLLIWKTTGKNRPALSYKVCALGRHYDSLTPMSTGGQPFQVYYLNKRGIPAGKAVSIPLGQYVTFMITYSLFTLVIMISSFFLSSNTSSVGSTIVSAGSWIGFALNFALVFIVCLISINKKVGTGLITLILKLLKKLHIIKNYEQNYNKTMNVVGDYQKTMMSYAKSKSTLFLMIFLSLAIMVTKYSIPYIIYSMFNGFNPAIFTDIFIKTVMIDLASGFIPLPGGSGVAELSFTAFFSSLLGADVFWAMLIWRIFTYYGHMIRGIVIIIYDYIHGNKKHEWLQKKWQLEEESKNFEDAQLRDFEMTLVKQNKRKNKIKGK